MAWSAAGFEFGRDGVLCLLVRRVVVEFEQVGALTINTLMIVRLQNNTLLARRGMTTTIGCIDRIALDVVQQQPHKRLVKTLTHSIVRNRGAVIERRPIPPHMDDDLGCQVVVLA